MRRITKITGLFIGIFLLVIAGIGSTASALPIEFDGTISGADVKATLNYSWIDPTTLEIKIDNESPTTDIDGASNSPAIVGFGFDSENDVSLSSDPLTVKAFEFIGGPGSGTLTDISTFWKVEENEKLQGTGGIEFDFVPTTTNGVHGGLINPNADGLTGSDLYETRATFTLEFENSPGLLDDNSWWMKFQNVGKGGENSLAVPGGGGPPIPEPTTILLVGLGLIGLAGFRKKLRK